MIYSDEPWPHINIKNFLTKERYEATTQRCTLNVFFVQPDLIIENRIENRFLINT